MQEKSVKESLHQIQVSPLPEDATRPLWSVMIPTYNCAKYLRRTLAAVLIQDPGPEHMQIEVVDDCSTQDDPEEVVRELAGDRVSFYRQPHNLGHTGNFATCLQRSRGYLIHQLHGDDLVLPGFYASLQKAFEQNPNIGAAFCLWHSINEQDQIVFTHPPIRKESSILTNWFESIAAQNVIQTPTIVVRRKVYEEIGGFDHRLSYSEDWEMWARIASQYEMWYEAEPLAAYREHSSSSTSRHMRTGADKRDLRRAIKIMHQYAPADRAKYISRRALFRYGYFALEQSRRLLISSHDLPASINQLREAILCYAAGAGFWTNYAPEIIN